MHAAAFTSSAGNVGSFRALKGGECANLRLSTVADDLTTSGETAALPKPSNSNKSVKSKKRYRYQAKKGGKSKNQSSKRSSNDDKQKKRSYKPLKDLKLGSTVSGKVVEVCEFGAFVDIGYSSRGSRPGTGLLHISQIRDDKVEKVEDVISKGNMIEDARVIKIDYVKGEVGLSLRKSRPKRKDISEFKVRDKLVGRVDTVLPYGAFVDVGANVNPLLHISRISGSAVENIRHYVNEGDLVPVHVIDIDVEKKTMAVSMLDKKADQYLDRRLSQKKRKFFGTAKDSVSVDVEDESELDYFDKAIQELEAALRERT
jgi:ribosomal protein S1